MSILVSFGEFFGEFFPPSHPCVCDTLLDIFHNLLRSYSLKCKSHICLEVKRMLSKQLVTGVQ